VFRRTDDENGSNGEVYDTSLVSLLNPTHPITAQFINCIVHNAGTLTLLGRPNVFKMRAPLTDLPFLAERFLAPSIMFNKYNLFSDEIRYYDTSMNANPIGDLEHPSCHSFCQTTISRKASLRQRRRLY
jgi:hypothetical protein